MSSPFQISLRELARLCPYRTRKAVDANLAENDLAGKFDAALQEMRQALRRWS
jgi:hypothetical protein